MIGYIYPIACMYSAAVTGSVSGGILLLIAIMVVAISVITVIFRKRQYYRGRAHKNIGIVAVH